MRLKLPSFEGKYSSSLTVCGAIDLRPGEKPDIASADAMIATFGRGPTAGFIRAWIQHEKKGPACIHVDCARKSSFARSRFPKATHTQSDISRLIEPFLDLDMEAMITGHFEVAKGDLRRNGLIGALSQEQAGSGEVGIRMTGSTLQLSGVPISEIFWKEAKAETGRVLVGLKGKKQVKISGVYLAESWEWIIQQFHFFIFGKH